MVISISPTQVTLVPDKPDVLTSCAGWDTIKNQSFLKDIILELKENNIRTSIFVDPREKMIEGAKRCETDRIELYTESFAKEYLIDRDKAIEPYIIAADKALELNIGINAGHDLNMNNLRFFAQHIKCLEVSIGHAIISDALYLGLEKIFNLNLVSLHKNINFQYKK